MLFRSVRVGDRVLVSGTPWCGHCHQCLSGTPEWCNYLAPNGVPNDPVADMADGTGVIEAAVIGGLSEIIVAYEEYCVPIFSDIPDEQVAMLGEIVRFDFGGEQIRRGFLQIGRWLAGPSESFIMIPLHAAAIAVLVRVAFMRGCDGWLRLTALALLAQHPVALFYLSADRYYYLQWFITMLVCMVWLRDDGLAMLRARSPRTMEWLEANPLTRWLSTVLDWWAAFTGVVNASRRRRRQSAGARDSWEKRTTPPAPARRASSTCWTILSNSRR